MNLSKSQLKGNENLKASITVTNSGNFDGEETVQLYIRDKVASITRPVKELKGFKTVFLKKGESQQLTFRLNPDDLKFYNEALQFVADIEARLGALRTLGVFAAMAAAYGAMRRLTDERGRLRLDRLHPA